MGAGRKASSKFLARPALLRWSLPSVSPPAPVSKPLSDALSSSFQTPALFSLLSVSFRKRDLSEFRNHLLEETEGTPDTGQVLRVAQLSLCSYRVLGLLVFLLVLWGLLSPNSPSFTLSLEPPGSILGPGMGLRSLIHPELAQYLHPPGKVTCIDMFSITSEMRKIQPSRRHHHHTHSLPLPLSLDSTRSSLGTPLTFQVWRHGKSFMAKSFSRGPHFPSCQGVSPESASVPSPPGLLVRASLWKEGQVCSAGPWAQSQPCQPPDARRGFLTMQVPTSSLASGVLGPGRSWMWEGNMWLRIRLDKMPPTSLGAGACWPSGGAELGPQQGAGRDRGFSVSGPAGTSSEG